MTPETRDNAATLIAKGIDPIIEREHLRVESANRNDPTFIDMTEIVFEAPTAPVLPIAGQGAGYPLRRIFCVGRNYAAHAAEMGGEVDREAPWYFTKSTMAYCPNDMTVPYPPGTSNYHHEIELVVALGTEVFQCDQTTAEAAIYAYAVGLDMTRRDRQQDGKDQRRPWDLGKDVELSAPISMLTKAADFGALGDQSISLDVNGQCRQEATLADMVWSPSEVVSHLSHYYHLGPGDVIMMGTPAGVGPVEKGDRLVGRISGLDPIIHQIKS